MPKLNINGANIHYEDRGSGEETIVFSHGLLFSGRMFDEQVAVLEDRYRCITFDHRGQGQTEVTESGYDIDSLTEDARALIEALDCAPCHFVGLSMGGFVGMRLAIRYSQLLKSLVLMETSADQEPEENMGQYNLLNFIARWFGLRLVISRVMPIMFGQKFLNDPTREQEKKEWADFIVANHRIGITRAVKGTLVRQSVYDQIDQIAVPTLIIVGDQDVATVPEKSERIHDKIPNSKLVVITGAGHSSTIEEPAVVNATIKSFLDDQ